MTRIRLQHLRVLRQNRLTFDSKVLTTQEEKSDYFERGYQFSQAAAVYPGHAEIYQKIFRIRSQGGGTAK